MLHPLHRRRSQVEGQIVDGLRDENRRFTKGMTSTYLVENTGLLASQIGKDDVCSASRLTKRFSGALQKGGASALPMRGPKVRA
jgi:hypothetical protein